jgi:hypothetical protein
VSGGVFGWAGSKFSDCGHISPKQKETSDTCSVTVASYGVSVIYALAAIFYYRQAV